MLILTVPLRSLASCQEDIGICDRAVQKTKAELKLSDLALKQTLATKADLETQVDDKNKQLTAWYRNPFVMAALGLVAGVALTR